MERFVKGDIIVFPFPFSDLSANKRRPALILSVLEGDELILCQITSEARYDKYSIELKNSDFKQGKLNIISMIRSNRLFTGEKSLIKYKIGSLKESKLNNVIDKLIKIFKE